MSTDSTAVAVLVSGVAGLLLGVAIFVLRKREASVADRVSSYVSVRRDDIEVGKSLIERALGDKQARKIARSPLIDAAEDRDGGCRSQVRTRAVNGALTLLATILVGWLL